MQKWLSLKKWAYVIHCLGQGSVTKTRILPQWFRAESTRLQGAEWLTEAQAGTGEADTRMSFWQQFPKLTRPVRGLLPPLQPQGRWLQHHTTTAKMENIVTKKLPPSESHNDQEVVWLQRRYAPPPGSPCPAMTSQMCALHPACQSSRSRRLEPALLIPSPAGQRLHRPVSRNSRHSRNLANGRPKRAFELSQLCCAGRGSRRGENGCGAPSHRLHPSHPLAPQHPYVSFPRQSRSKQQQRSAPPTVPLSPYRRSAPTRSPEVKTRHRLSRHLSLSDDRSSSSSKISRLSILS